MGKLTKQQQTIVAVVLALAVGIYGYWNYMLKPLNEKITTQTTKYNELLGQIETAERQARRLPALTSERDRLQVELAALEKQLPRGRDLPSIIRTLTREAIQENLQFGQLSPRTPVRSTYFETIPFEVRFTGTLHALARFLASLGQQERIFQAQNIVLTPQSSSEQGFIMLNISLTIQTYSYVG